MTRCLVFCSSLGVLPLGAVVRHFIRQLLKFIRCICRPVLRLMGAIWTTLPLGPNPFYLGSLRSVKSQEVLGLVVHKFCHLGAQDSHPDMLYLHLRCMLLMLLVERGRGVRR